MFEKTKINEKEAGIGPFLKKQCGQMLEYKVAQTLLRLLQKSNPTILLKTWCKLWRQEFCGTGGPKGSKNLRRTHIDQILDWPNGLWSTWTYLFKHTKCTPFVKPRRFGQSGVYQNLNYKFIIGMLCNQWVREFFYSTQF